MKFESQLQITTAAGVAPLTVNQTQLVINLNADLLDGQHGSYYQDAGNLNAGTVPSARLSGSYNINITGNAGGVSVSDNRSSATTPQTINMGVVWDFKTNTTDGLSDGGTYFGEMTFRQYGSGTDWTGGLSHQLGFTDNGNIWQRSGSSTTWGAWKKLLDSSNYGGYSTFTGTVTGTNFSGPGTGLTGTAAALNIGGTAAIATNIADGAVSTSAKIAASVVTYAKIQNVSVSTVLGNSSASVAQAPQELSMATLAGMLSGQTMNIVGSSTSCTGNAATATNVAWSGITSKPTTLAGFGITDALDTSATAQTKSGNLTVNSALTSGGAFYAATTVQYSNRQQIYTVYYGGGQDLNWKKIADITIGVGLYRAVTFRVDVVDNQGNFGWNSDCYPMTFFASCRRSGGVQDSYNDAWVTGPVSDYVRVVKTALGVYELQIRQLADWQTYVYTAEATINSGTVVTYVSGTPPNGSTTGTVYAPTIDWTQKLAKLVVAGSATFASQITSSVATGTAPFSVASTTVVTNLNSDLLDGQHGAYYENRDTTAVGFSGGTLTLTRATGNLTVSLDGRYLTGNQSITLSGDVTGTGTTAITTTIPNSTITNAKLNTMGAGTIKGNNGGVANSPSDLTAAQVATMLSGQTMNIAGSSTSCTGNAASASSVPWSGITSKPTTLSGYGITDALPLSGGTLTGNLALNTGVIFNRGSAPSITNIQCSIFNELNGIGSAESLNFRAYAGFKWQYWDGSATWMQLTSSGLTINGNNTLHAGNYGGYSTFSGTVTGSSFSGAGTGLTGTAASLTAGAVPWSGVTGKPTTLSGYGITDAMYQVDPNGFTQGDIYGSGNMQRLWGTDSVQNLIAFRPPTTVEYTTDGVNWTATTISNDVFDGKVFGKWGGFNMNVGSNIGAWTKVRMTWVNFGYHFFSHFTLCHSTNGHSMNFVFYKSDLNGVFGAESYRVNGISSWPGYTFTSHVNISGWWDTRDVRMVFELIGNNGPSGYPNNAISVGHIGIMGGYSSFNRVYDWDGNRNITLYGTLTVPGAINANGGLSGTTGTFSGVLNANGGVVVNNNAGVRSYYGSDTADYLGYGVQFGRVSSYLRPTTNRAASLYVGDSAINSADWANINFYSSGTFAVNNNAILHAGNYSSIIGYTPAYGTAAYQTKSLDTVSTPGLYQYDGGFGGTKPPDNKPNYRTIEIGSGGRWTQIALPWDNDGFFFRRQQDTTYTSWRTVLHDGNYGGYSTFSGTVTGSSFSGAGTGLTGTANSLNVGGYSARWATGRTISLTGDVTATSGTFDGTANISFAATIANSAVTYAKIQNVAVSSVLGNSSASVAQAPAALSMATLAGMLSGQTMNIAGSSTSCTGNAATATNVAWSGITSKPTTLSGFGITDAIDTSATSQTKSGNLGVGVASAIYKLQTNSAALFNRTAFGVLDINSGGSPNFIKIQTAIPFSYGAQAYTVNIRGFTYDGAQTVDITVCWHQYADTFYNPTVSSSGSFAPTVRLARENSNVVICLTWGAKYWPKLYVESVHNYDLQAYSTGWSWVDADITGDKVVTLSYKNDWGGGMSKDSSGNLTVTGTLSATSFSGAGTGLTGTAASLNIGGNAAGLTNGSKQLSAGSANWIAWKSTSADSSASAIALYGSTGSWFGMLYGDSGGTGFLNTSNGWDLRKAINGELYATVSGTAQTVIHSGNYTSYLNNTYLRAAGHPGYGDWNTFGNTAQTVHQIYQENFNLPTSTGSSNFPNNASYKYGTLINFGTGSDARAQVYISHAGNDLVFRGGWTSSSWQTWNRCVTDVNFPSFGTHQASIGNSLPTTVFMSTDANIRQAPFATAKAHLGITSKWANSRANLTGDSNYWTGVMGWGTTDWNSVFDWGSGFADSWSSPANNPGDTSHHLAVQAVHYTNGTSRYGWQMVNGAGTNRWWLRDVWGGAFSSWREVIHSGNYNNYTPTLTGTGASGSWGINITGSSASCTGNAATCTTANGIADGTVSTTAKLANSVVTYAKIQNVTAYTVLGNSSPSAAQAPVEINMASLASMLSGNTMNISGSSTSCSGNAATASAVAASGITGQTGMWTSAARPGPYRLYRRDDNSNYSVQTYWTGTYWRLDGYYSNDTVHAGCSVSYADSAGSVSTIADGAVSTTAKLANSVVTYAKIQNVGASSVLGNTSASVSQAPQEITFANLGPYINGVARAWVTFNENPSTGAITINASLGISSVTRINYGQYRVNFSTAFADANYAVSGTIGYESNGGYLYGGFLNIPRVATPKTTTYCEVTASYGDGNTYNARFVHVVFDR